MGRLSWENLVGPKCNHESLTRERQEKMWCRQKRNTLRGEGRVKMEPEMGVTQPQDREYWQPPEAGRGKAQILLQSLQRFILDK